MLLAGVILILIIFALIGWRKGVIRLVLSLVSMIITIMAAVVKYSSVNIYSSL